MYRATALIADTTYRYSNTTYNVTAQTLGYWEYLDRVLGDTDYSGFTEDELGELYVRYQAEPERPSLAALRPYLRAVEETGWVHPASARLLELWTGHFARLGLYDPGLTVVQHPGLGLEETIEHLAARGLCLDCRRDDGPVYLDLTRYGSPLRQIVTRNGQPNYLAGALRELVPVACRYDETVLVHDRELTEDYVLLQRLVNVLGGNAVRDAVDRVPIDGVVRSSRFGGWLGHTVRDLLKAGADAEPAALRLGMRLYFHRCSGSRARPVLPGRPAAAESGPRPQAAEPGGDRARWYGDRRLRAASSWQWLPARRPVPAGLVDARQAAGRRRTGRRRAGVLLMFGQDLLRAELGRRIAWAVAGPDSPRPEPPEPVDAEAAERDAPDVSAVAVLRRFDPAVFARSAVQFALGLSDEQRVAWFRAFTRTVFLAGNPENLVERFPGAHVSPDR
jgi:hypothetical protein